MKTSFFVLVFTLFAAALSSCTTDVDLYADYKDITIVYAMLNPKADTNYVKITRAFCGTNDNPINANEIAQIYEQLFGEVGCPHHRNEKHPWKCI